MVSSLGAVPIPSATSAQAMPIATQNRPQLLAMGAPVRATLPGGVDAVVTALGPQEQTPYTGGATPPRSTVGIITVTMAVTHGDLAVRSSDFTSRDETGKLVVLAARGPAAVHLRAGQSAQIEVSGRFTSGSAQVTWRHAGHVVALWDFTVELD